jgi:hypothetical protein
LRWGGAAVAVVVLLFLVSGWWGLFFTLLVAGLYEAGLTYVATRPVPASSAEGAVTAPS